MKRDHQGTPVCTEIKSLFWNVCDRDGSTRSRCSLAAAVESVDPRLVLSTAPCTLEEVPGSPTTTVPLSPVKSQENRSDYCEENMYHSIRIDRKFKNNEIPVCNIFYVFKE